MKVLMLSTDRKILEPKSGVHNRMLGYAKGLDELFIVVLGMDRDLKIEGKLKYVGLTRFRALFWRPPGRFDLVTGQDPFETGLIAIRLAKIIGAQLELQIHTDIGSPYFQYESLKNRVRYFLSKFLLPKADRIRVVSQRIKDHLVSDLGIVEDKIYIKPIFVDIEKIKNTPITVDLHKKYPQFDKIILMASRLTKEKNIDLAINAMSPLIRANRRIGLVIVGSGPEEKKLQSASWRIQAHIVFEPWVDQETLYSYYKTCDLFLVTSWYEGYGMTLVEAHAAGCPIVSTDVGVAREMGARIVDLNYSSVAKGIIESL